MFSKYLRSKSSKKGKEISLVVESGNGENLFVVKLPKRLLVDNSAVFKEMAANGDFKKSRKVKLEEVTVTGIKKIAEYLERESVYFQNHYEAMETLKAAYIYQIQAMNSICSDFLITITDTGNVSEIYEFADNFSFHNLQYHCLKFIDKNADDILKSPAFLTLKKSTVLDIIKRNSLNVSSELIVFRTIISWGLNHCVRQGTDADREDELMASVKSLLEKIRFLTMSEDEMADLDVDKFYKLLCSDDSAGKRKSLLGLESKSSTVDYFIPQARKYETEYVHSMEICGLGEHSVKNGESFCLSLEILKGRPFLIGVTLAFDTFVNSKNTACLFVTASAMNVQTSEQKSTRGTFLNTCEVAELKFPSPLVANVSEVIKITLNVKRAENICPIMLKSDIQIVMPETKDVAMKVITTKDSERSIFRNIKYFF